MTTFPAKLVGGPYDGQTTLVNGLLSELKILLEPNWTWVEPEDTPVDIRIGVYTLRRPDYLTLPYSRIGRQYIMDFEGYVLYDWKGKPSLRAHRLRN